MDHGDLLRECRRMLLAISSQISLLLAGLQCLEGQQRHPQPPPPPPVPDGQLPPPPPSMTPPPLPATSGRPDYMTAPVTLVATSDNRTEHPAHVRTVSVSTSWEHRRRRRSRHREPRPDDAVMPTIRSTRQQSRPCRRVDHLVCRMTVDGTPAAKGAQYFGACMFASIMSSQFRSLTCLICPCCVFICHAVVSNLVAVLNVLASQIATGHPELCPDD